MCDFEKAFQNSLQDVFGANVNIVGCLFHLGQCIWRKIQQMNLVEAYRTDEIVRLKCKMLMALAFVPSGGIVDAFETIQNDIPDNVAGLYDYFEDTWIGRPARRGQRRNPLFAVELWSVHDRVVEGLPRTNNAVEGWHRAFQGTVGFVHPTVYKLIDAIRLEQSHTENVVTRINAGQVVTKKNAQYVRVDAAIQTLVANFGDRHIVDFLRGISYNVSLNV